MAGYTGKDAAKDTGASSKDVAAAHHDARDAAFGGREGSGRDYGSGGDRFGVDRGLMGAIESAFGLTGGKGKK